MIKMPNVNSNGKFGTSMDYSQLLDIKKRYKTVQRQNTKAIPGNQAVKPAFNSNKVISGSGVESGAVDYYMVKGLAELYKNPKLFR
jgi:hypothetical protein